MHFKSFQAILDHVFKLFWVSKCWKFSTRRKAVRGGADPSVEFSTLFNFDGFPNLIRIN